MNSLHFAPSKRRSAWGLVLGFSLLGFAAELAFAAAEGDSEALVRAALLAKERHQCVIAIKLFDEALQRGRFSREERGLLLYNRGACEESLGLLKQASNDFSSVIALLPDFVNAYNYRGIVWGELHEYDRAIADFEQAARLKPGDPLLYNNIGNCYAAKGDAARAIVNYDRAIELRRNYAEAYYNRADSFFAMRNDARALADYDEAIRLKPTYDSAFAGRGAVKLTGGQIERAITDFDEAVRLNPRNVVALMNRATAHLVADQPDEAFNDFSRAIEIDPGNAAAYLGRGRAALFADRSGTVDDFATARRLQPTSVYATLWLHIARVHRGEDDRGEFRDNSKLISRDTWPGILLSLYDGSASEDQVRKSAIEGTGEAKRKRECEVDFYIGEYATHNRPKAEARKWLLNAMSECRPPETAAIAAKVELSILDP